MEECKGNAKSLTALTSLFSEGDHRQALTLSKLSTSIRRLVDGLRGPIRGSEVLTTGAQW
jgi:hypothetical protein